MGATTFRRRSRNVSQEAQRFIEEYHARQKQFVERWTMNLQRVSGCRNTHEFVRQFVDDDPNGKSSYSLWRKYQRGKVYRGVNLDLVAERVLLRRHLEKRGVPDLFVLHKYLEDRN